MLDVRDLLICLLNLQENGMLSQVKEEVASNRRAVESDDVSLKTINHSVVPDKVKSHPMSPKGSLRPTRKLPAQRQRGHGESGPLCTAGGNGNGAFAVKRVCCEQVKHRVII